MVVLGTGQQFRQPVDTHSDVVIAEGVFLRVWSVLATLLSFIPSRPLSKGEPLSFWAVSHMLMKEQPAFTPSYAQVAAAWGCFLVGLDLEIFQVS